SGSAGRPEPSASSGSARLGGGWVRTPGSCGMRSSGVSGFVGHLAALDRPLVAADVDHEPSFAVDPGRGAAHAVYGHAPPAEEVARAQVDVDRVEPAVAPEVVVVLEPREDPREERLAVALDA